MEENYTKILWEGYGLRYYGGSRARTGFICKTDQGLREIKKASSKKENILFEQEVKEHLYQNGFQNIPLFCKTLDKQPFYALDGVYYVMEIPLNAQAMEEEEKNFIQGAALLGEFHQAGQGLKTSIEHSNVGKIPQICEKRKNELVRIKKRIDKQSCYNALDLLVRGNYEYYKERLEQAQAVFLSSDFEAVQEEAKRCHSICHNAFKGENIRQNERGTLYVTGLGRCAFDSILMDLAAYLRRYVKKTDGCFQTADKMLQVYQEKHPLSKQEWRSLIGLLLYPEKFLRLCNEYYNKRRVCVSPAMRERMERCIAGQDKNNQFLKELKAAAPKE